MKPLFGTPSPPSLPPPGEQAVWMRRELTERLLETLHYLSEETEPRRVGSLGEAQAAGFIAGRLRRAEQQAVVLSFRSDAPPWVVLALITAGVLFALAVPAVWPHPFVLVLSIVLVVLLTGVYWNELAGSAVTRQLLGRRVSQSVVGVRAAKSTSGPRSRAVVVAPLDRPPYALSRRISRSVLSLLVLQVAGYGIALTAPGKTWLAPMSVIVVVTCGLLALLLYHQRPGAPTPMVLGAGELAALVGVAEETGALEHTELWTVAAGGAAHGDAALRQLLRRYPFDQTTVVVNLERITGGPPVYVTREGVLRERRSDRRLLRMISDADARDVRINAEPRPLRRRTLANLLLQRGFAAITITSHPELRPISQSAAGPSSQPPRAIPRPDQATTARCVYLAVGLLHEIDRSNRPVE